MSMSQLIALIDEYTKKTIVNKCYDGLDYKAEEKLIGQDLSDLKKFVDENKKKDLPDLIEKLWKFIEGMRMVRCARDPKSKFNSNVKSKRILANNKLNFYNLQSMKITSKTSVWQTIGPNFVSSYNLISDMLDRLKKTIEKDNSNVSKLKEQSDNLFYVEENADAEKYLSELKSRVNQLAVRVSDKAGKLTKEIQELLGLINKKITEEKIV